MSDEFKGSPSPLPQKPATYTRINPKTGLVEVLDAITGRILLVQTSHHDLLESKWDRLVKIDTPEGPVWIEKGINFDYVKHNGGVPFSKHLGDLICEYITEGATLLEAAEKINLKYADICRWRRDNPDFSLALERAKQDRAEYHADKSLMVAEKSENPKLHVESLQWQAEKGNPEKYGSKMVHRGDKSSPIQFVIDTGIRRPGDQGFNEVPKDVVTTNDGVIDQVKGDVWDGKYSED